MVKFNLQNILALDPLSVLWRCREVTGPIKRMLSKTTFEVPFSNSHSQAGLIEEWKLRTMVRMREEARVAGQTPHYQETVSYLVQSC
jgi:translation initiation factor IF-1